MASLRLFALSLLLIPSVALAQPDWNQAERIDVTLSNFEYFPRTLHVRAGVPVRLYFVNASGGGHDFTARDFFAAATVKAEDQSIIDNGSIEVRGGETQDVALVPAAGVTR
jgi:uncharacterized cupredoxin-like copper-binding protein